MKLDLNILLQILVLYYFVHTVNICHGHQLFNHTDSSNFELTPVRGCMLHTCGICFDLHQT